MWNKWRLTCHDIQNDLFSTSLLLFINQNYSTIEFCNQVCCCIHYRINNILSIPRQYRCYLPTLAAINNATLSPRNTRTLFPVVVDANSVTAIPVLRAGQCETLFDNVFQRRRYLMGADIGCAPLFRCETNRKLSSWRYWHVDYRVTWNTNFRRNSRTNSLGTVSSEECWLSDSCLTKNVVSTVWDLHENWFDSQRVTVELFVPIMSI